MNKQKEFMPLWAYIDGRKRKIGYAYMTDKGNLCIKADKVLDKSALGRMAVNGLYVDLPQPQEDKAAITPLRTAWK